MQTIMIMFIEPTQKPHSQHCKKIVRGSNENFIQYYGQTLFPICQM